MSEQRKADAEALGGRIVAAIKTKLPIDDEITGRLIISSVCDAVRWADEHPDPSVWIEWFDEKDPAYRAWYHGHCTKEQQTPDDSEVIQYVLARVASKIGTDIEPSGIPIPRDTYNFLIEFLTKLDGGSFLAGFAGREAAGELLKKLQPKDAK